MIAVGVDFLSPLYNIRYGSRIEKKRVKNAASSIIKGIARWGNICSSTGIFFLIALFVFITFQYRREAFTKHINFVAYA